MFTKSFLKKIAQTEKVSLEFLERQMALGRIVIPLNNTRELDKPAAVGKGLKVKINTNLGTSTAKNDISEEIAKLNIAIEAGTTTVMDLSVGDDIAKMRKEIIKLSSVPVGTVPIYEAACAAENNKGNFEKLTFKDILAVLRRQAKEGVDFFTIHAGILRDTINILSETKRTCGIVSRGGAILTRWMYVNRKENPFYENFDKILDLAKEYNITISLGDALRPGAIADATDQLQLAELNVLGELVKRCRKNGVQVIVEGPGHVPLNEIAFNIVLEKKICHNAPFYVLGPLPTDIAAGYDHISSAIGGAIAALNGADFLCVVTPAEHLRHPSIDDIREGVMASRIAAHSVDILRFPDEMQKDNDLSLYRAHRQWDKIFPLTLNPEKAKSYRGGEKSADKLCSMCGNFCSLKIIEKCNLLK